MLPKSTQRKLALYFASMISLHGFVLFKSWGGIGAGLPDFSIFYTAGRILHDGRRFELYDNGVQEEVQRSFSPAAVEKRKSILPYNHPPFEALLFAPLARFSYRTAYCLWLTVNVCLLVVMTLILRRYFAHLGRAPVHLWLLACFGFYPIFCALLQGQDSILVLFCYCMAYVTFRDESEFRAGAWLGLGLCKFHLIFPFALPLVIVRRRKFIAGFAAVAMVSLAIGLATVGWHGFLQYPRYVWDSEHNPNYRWQVPVRNIANLRGTIASLLPGNHPGGKAMLLFALSAMLLLSVAYAWKRAQTAGLGCRDLAFTLNLIAALLVSYHLYIHDLSLLFLGILIIGETVASTHLAKPWLKTTILLCVAVLFCSPVYLILFFRFQQLQLLAVVLLVLFMALLSWWAALASAAKPPPTLAGR
jgi:Glycosyltransferase family 87